MKGYRTFLLNIVGILVVSMGVVLQYIGMLGLTDRQVAFAAISLTIFKAVLNLWLRTQTDTKIFKAE